jgi:hypothetical protein
LVKLFKACGFLGQSPESRSAERETLLRRFFFAKLFSLRLGLPKKKALLP